MTQPSFLARKTFGCANYYWIALSFALVVAMVPYAARQALHSNTNKAEDWLPDTYTESQDLRWFRQHFLSEGFVLVTWDGLTLGNADKLRQLEQILKEKVQVVEPGAVDAFRAKITRHTGKWFRKIITGPSMIDELTEPPLNLRYAAAVRRLQGSLIGPAQLDAEGRPDDSTRTTCLVAYMSPEGYEDNRAMREVVSYIHDKAIEVGVPEPQLHMGGPSVDNVTIDRVGEGSLVLLAAASGIVGLVIAYGCLRNLQLTAVVVAIGAISAATSLALVYYFGVIEVLVFGRERPFYGTMDAVLMSMPALVYVLGVSGAIHFINYYRESRMTHGLEGAVERAVRGAWIPCGLVALTAAIGFGSLITSDIVPIRKFGGFSAAGIIAALVILFTAMPIYLHLYPPRSIGRRSWGEMTPEDDRLPPWGAAFYRWLTRRHALVTTVMLGAMAVAAFGLLRLESTVSLLKLLDDKSDLVQDYTWVEHHMGNLVPMEVVLTVPQEKRRSGDEHTELDGKRPLHQYRMTMLERMSMVRHVAERIESLKPDVGRPLSAATLAPDESRNGTETARRAENYATNKNLEDNRRTFRDYLQFERTADGKIGPRSREIWRISARVTALKDIDYGRFTEKLRDVVEPVLFSYRQRDELVRTLQDSDGTLTGSRLCVLFRGPLADAVPADGGPEGLLFQLLKESDGVRGVACANMSHLSNPDLPPNARAQAMADFRKFDAVLLATESLRDEAGQLAAEGVKVVDLTRPRTTDASATEPFDASLGPEPVRSLYTGIIPLVFKTQRQLLTSLRSSMFSSGVLIVIVMAIVFRSAMAGIVSMLPNLFPVILVFGTLGLLGVKMDIGIVMTASVALGVAVDSTVHLVTWFYHAQSTGLDRRAATLMAYDHCAAATVQGALISGLGLAVFAASSFTPTRQFGYLMIVIQSTALLGDLVLLPALFCGPLGRFFERPGRGRRDDPLPDLAADDAAMRQTVRRTADLAATVAEGRTAARNTHPDSVPAPLKAAATAGRAAAGQSNGERIDNGHAPPVPRRNTEGEPLESPAHSALRDKLRTFRRD